MTLLQATEKLGRGPGNKALERGLSPLPRANFLFFSFFFEQVSRT